MNGFLFDENIPTGSELGSSIPIVCVGDLNLGLTDSKIWAYAREKALVIVTKDSDFSHRIMLSSPPPWIVHLRFGNMKRSAFRSFLAKSLPQIEALLPGHKLINVFLDRIEAISESHL